MRRLGVCHQHLRIPGKGGISLYPDPGWHVQWAVFRDRRRCGTAMRLGGGDPLSHSQGVTSLSNCYLEISGRSPTGMLPEMSLVEADGGKLQLRGCSFRSRGKEPHVVLKRGLTYAIVTENDGVNGFDIVNEIGDGSVIVNNEPRSRQSNRALAAC